MPGLDPLVDPGIFVKVVVLTEFTLVQDLVNHLTAFKAKHFFSRPDPGIQAGFATVIALNFLFGNYS